MFRRPHSPLDAHPASPFVDAHEPPNGDFASYVEQLVQLPKDVKVTEQEPAQPVRLRPASDAAWGATATEHTPEGLMTAPPAPRTQGPAHGSTGNPRRLPGSPQARTQPGAGATPQFDLEDFLVGTAGKLGRIVRRLSSLLIFGGIALIAFALSDQHLIRLDPGPGFGLLVAGFVLRRLASKVS